MHLLVVGLRWPPEAFLARRLAGLVECGFRVSVVGGTSGAETPRALREIRRVPLSTASLRDADVVHFEWNSAAIDALVRNDLWARPTVISCRGTQVRVRPHVTPGYADQLRETFQRATLVHCVCDMIRDEAVALGLNAAKAVVIHPAVDIAEFRPSMRTPYDGPLRMLAVGALIWTKGYEYMLLTLRRLLDQGVPARLEIIGAGNEHSRVLFTIQDLQLGAAVTLRGQLPPSEVLSAMQHCDLFVHSSLSEGIPNAVLEAMACGVPVVTSDCGGIREAVTNGHDGMVVPVRDPDAAATAVAQLAGDADIRARLGGNARGTIELRFRLNHQIEEWIALYQRAVNEATT